MIEEHRTSTVQDTDREPCDIPWAERAHELADWALGLMVRDDVHGAYLAVGGDDGRVAVKPYTRHASLTRDRLARHFAARATGDVVGIHVGGPDETCRLVVVDIDLHGADDAALATSNSELALRAHDRARDAGLDARLLDSNGRGGYHIWVHLGEPAPMADAFRIGKWLVHGHGSDKAPETFPKGPALTGKRCGSWVRLPGRHPKRDHWTRAWDADRRLWLEGDAAIDSLVGLRGRPVDLVGLRAEVERTFPPAAARARPWPIDDGSRYEDRDYQRQLDQVRSALPYLDDLVDDYDDWLTIGMALAQLGDDGLVLWHRWSALSPKYDPDVLDAKWDSFAPGDRPGDGGRVSLGTLFHRAQEAGWPGPHGVFFNPQGRPGVRARMRLTRRTEAPIQEEVR